MKKKVEYVVTLAELMAPKIAEIEAKDNIKLQNWIFSPIGNAKVVNGDLDASKITITFSATLDAEKVEAENLERKIDLKL
jgi:hypothetical protein